MNWIVGEVLRLTAQNATPLRMLRFLPTTSRPNRGSTPMNMSGATGQPLALCRPNHGEVMTKKPQQPNIIREIRQENKLSVKEFAEKLGVSPRTVENWEQGRAMLPQSRHLIKVVFGR
jgi:DNA-binding transcriptional regulator YiaG